VVRWPHTPQRSLTLVHGEHAIMHKYEKCIQAVFEAQQRRQHLRPAHFQFSF
jgi:hypothetical protein